MTDEKKITLAPLSKDHIDHVMDWVNDPEVNQFFASMKKQHTREEELAYIESLINSKTDRVYSVFDRDEYIGQVSINQIHWQSGEGRLFLVINKKHQGRGYARRILKEIEDIAFIYLGLHRLYLIVRPENEKGLQIYHGCGFRQEGYLHEKYFLDGKWMDMIQMAVIKPWWQTWWMHRK